VDLTQGHKLVMDLTQVPKYVPAVDLTQGPKLVVDLTQVPKYVTGRY